MCQKYEGNEYLLNEIRKNEPKKFVQFPSKFLRFAMCFSTKFLTSFFFLSRQEDYWISYGGSGEPLLPPPRDDVSHLIDKKQIANQLRKTRRQACIGLS